MSTEEQNRQLNNFSTIVSIMAVVVSLIITLGGYFATNATIVEKIDRLEKVVPKLEDRIREIENEDAEVTLMIQKLQSNIELKSSVHRRDIDTLMEALREWNQFQKEYSNEHHKMKRDIIDDLQRDFKRINK